MIELLFFFCLPTISGYDCSYNAYLDTPENIQQRWLDSGNKGNVAAMWDGYKSIYIPNMELYHHEWRHAFCDNHWNQYQKNHTYCLDPHFKIQR